MSAVVDPTAANIDQRCGRTYRRQRLASAEPSDDDDIHRVEHQLQNAGHHQRQRKGNQLVHNRAVAHVDFIFVLFQKYSSFFCSRYAVLHRRHIQK